MRGFVAPRDDELLGGPVGEQRLDFRTVLVQLAFAGAFRPSDRQAGSPSRAKGILRPRGDQLRSIAATIVPPKSRSKSSPKIGGRQIDDTDTVSIGVANCKHNWFRLQTARFLGRINCDYRGGQNRINCK